MKKVYNVIITQNIKTYKVIVSDDVNVIIVGTESNTSGQIIVGPPGPAGEPGLQGEKGLQGVRGLQGLRGLKGDNGLSNYQIAIANGTFIGTELEYAQMLVSLYNRVEELEKRHPYTLFKFLQKGFGNYNLEENELGDVFSGWSDDGTLRYPEAKWIGGPLNTSTSFIPLITIIIES